MSSSSQLQQFIYVFGIRRGWICGMPYILPKTDYEEKQWFNSSCCLTAGRVGDWSNKTELSITWMVKDKMSLTRYFGGWLLGWFLAWLHAGLRGRLSTWLSTQLPKDLLTFLHSVVPSLLCAVLPVWVSAVVRGQLCAWLCAQITALLHACCLKLWGNRGTYK